MTICIGRPIIEILAREGAWSSESGESVVAADDLFNANPYAKIKRAGELLDLAHEDNVMLRAEVERLRARIKDAELSLAVWDDTRSSEYWLRHVDETSTP